ncbi:sigma-70 family RNA polymerase sigma factor [Fodinicola feengrottensis]|uniref:Sigma-70 family RNA polymerase sigma factor SigG n=1 Tax=Fodinicola feengrottensis TaxID=435914 RepID=A0ABN2IRB0_9ACTN|nr:sigma-70 family RNA polymerase sigma factor [Fodinicola feengrottensis]
MDDLALAQGGDGAAFDRLIAPLRGELRAHCYRMLGSIHDADDALQDALLRAWRGLARFEGRSSLRGWLYTVSTRTCLDLVKSRGRRALPMDLGPSSKRAVLDSRPLTEVSWLSPYPDAGHERREAVELAFVAALQHLSGNQRAALLLFEVLGFSAAEIATMMDTSTTAVNSALARARQRMPAADGPAVQGWAVGNAKARELAAGFATALQRGDADALIALLTEDVTWSMPPLPHWYAGIAAVTDFAVEVPLTRCPSWRSVLTSANGQPAVACYLGEDADGPHRPWSINVLTLRADRICAITSFLDTDHFPLFELPSQL